MPKFLTAVWLALAVLAIPAHAGSAPRAALTADDITQQIEDFLRNQAASYGGETQVSVEPPRIERLAPCELARPFLSSGTRLRSRLSVGIQCLEPNEWVSFAQASLVVNGVYYVASQGLRPGTVITLSDLTARDGDLLRLATGVLHKPEQIVGRITTQRIGIGAPIKTSALRSAESIERGQVVRLEARGAGFTASTDGTALQRGEPGAQIQVRTASGQTVTGTVMGAHTVLVFL